MLAYKKPSAKTQEEAIVSVQVSVEAEGFKVLNTLDIGDILHSKGLERDPIVILEVCHANSAYTLLAQNVDMGLFLPCKITIYRQAGQTFISALDPHFITQLIRPDSQVEKLVDEISSVLYRIVDNAV
ncbi:MAG: DUF302 domain-containing protein [Firmicutes bacterium]|nr:DUF302 domain-containing protein [Bacillota bacterium]